MLARLFGDSWEFGLLLARIALGAVFIAHGYDKLFGNIQIEGVTGMLSGMGFPAPELFAWVLSLTELFGGIAIIIGMLSRYAALGLGITMIIAIFRVKLDLGLIAPIGSPMPGYELDVALLALALVVLFAGPGRFSLDKAMFSKEL